MRFMAGGQLPLEPFVANKHLILNPTTSPRAADEARESPPARSSTPSAKSRWTNIRRDSTAGFAAQHSSSSIQQMLVPSPSTTVNCASEGPTLCPLQEQDFWSRDDYPKRRASWHRSESRLRRGRRDHRRRISSTPPCRFGSPLDVGIDRPASAVGEPLRPQTCRPRL